MGLPELSDAIRNNLKWVLLAILLVIFLWLIWGIISSLSGSAFPSRKADTAFGKIAPPVFTKTFKKVVAGQFQFSADSQTGEQQTDVFRIVSQDPFTEDQLRQIVSFFNLTSATKESKDKIVTWQDKNTGGVLRLNTSTNHFSFRLDLAKNASLLSGNLSGEESTIVKNSKDLLSSKKLLPKDIADGSATVKYFSVASTKRAEIAKAQANSAEVSLFRKVGNTDTTGDAPIRILLGPNQKILEYDYTYTQLDNVGSLYPIINKQEALSDLQAGKALSPNPSNYDSVTVSDPILSYWESAFSQPYLQPVWVFIGKAKKGALDSDFRAYLPAVSSSFLEVSGSELPEPLP